MAPKNKFTKEQIVEAAFEIARKEGIDNISIRKVATQLGSSIAPIYVNFTDVEELKKAVIKKIYHLSQDLLLTQYSPNPFLSIGIASLKFAREYPRLFQDLLNNQHYLAEVQPSPDNIFSKMKQSDDLVGFTTEELMELMFKMRVFQLGLSVMEVHNMLPADLDEGRLVQILESTGKDLKKAMRLRKTEKEHIVTH